MPSTIVKKRRLNRLICRKCKARNPPEADKCRKCGSKQLRMKSKERRGIS